VATLSAVTTFPPPLPTGRNEAAEALFVAARDAYLGRDWLAAETKLRGLLVVAPTDGEAQLLLATLLRRVDRRAESRAALEKLSRSDAGRPWQAVIRRELARLKEAKAEPTVDRAADQVAGIDDAPEAVVLRLPGEECETDSAASRAA
jgi:thioredoxin-like negative regulator of GroEL